MSEDLLTAKPYRCAGFTLKTVVTKIGKKRVVVIPKAIAEEAKISEGQKIRITTDGERIIIEPIRDAIWLALYGKKIGRIEPDEIEEESMHEQEKLSEK